MVNTGDHFCMSGRATKIGRPPAGEIELRKRRILDIAAERFIAGGYEKTTLDAIAKVAGVTKRTIYENIGDKVALFHAVCTERLPQALKAEFDLRPKGKSTRENLRGLARTVLNYSLSEETVALTRMLMVERIRFPDLVGQAAGAMRALYNELIRTALDEMVELGLLPPSSTSHTADYFYDIVVGNALLQMLFGIRKKGPGNAEIDERIDIFLYGHLDGKGTGRNS